MKNWKRENLAVVLLNAVFAISSTRHRPKVDRYLFSPKCTSVCDGRQLTESERGKKEGTAKCQEMRHDEGGNYFFNRVFIFAYHCFSQYIAHF